MVIEIKYKFYKVKIGIIFNVLYKTEKPKMYEILRKLYQGPKKCQEQFNKN